MANEFLKPEVIADTTLELLQRDIVLPRLVWNNAVADWSGKAGDKVTLRVPARLDARERELRATTEIVLDELTETGVDIELDKLIYSAVAITDEQLTLDIEDFARQVLDPQTSAIAYAIENKLVATMEAAPYAEGHTVDATGEDLYEVLVDVRGVMNKAYLPSAGRTLVVGPDFEAQLLKSDRLIRNDSIGAPATTALQEATVGRIAGFDVVLSQALADPGSAFAFHTNSFVLSLQAPVVPAGVAYGASVASNGLAMRHVRDYDSKTLNDRSIASVFAGSNAVVDGGEAHDEFVRAVYITGGGEAGETPSQ